MESCETFTADTSETECNPTPVAIAKQKFRYYVIIVATIIQFMTYATRPDKPKFYKEVQRASCHITKFPDDETKLNRMLNWDARNVVCHVYNCIENEFDVSNCEELTTYDKSVLPFINKDWAGKASFIDRLTDVMNIITDGINRNFNYNPSYMKISDIWERIEVYKTVIDKLDPKSGKLIVGLIESSKSIDPGWTKWITD